MFDQFAPLTMAALCAVASVMFASAAVALYVADKREQRARRATVMNTNDAWVSVWANARANRATGIRRAAGRMAAHGEAARASYGDASGMVADTLGDAFEYVEARTHDAAGMVYRAHVRIETAAGRMVSHSFDVRADDAREAREWAWFALYESGASGRSHVTMIRHGGRIVA